MAANEDLLAFRRVLVALDASRRSERMLRRAMELAERRRTALLGLFIEDSDLLRSAHLPATRVLGPASGALQALEAARLERWLRRQALQLQGVLADREREPQLRWTLETRRGRADAVLEAVEPLDLLLLGRREPGFGQRLGPLERELLSTAPCPILLQGSRAGGDGVMAWLDGGDDLTVLETAARLAEHEEVPLIAALAAADPATAEALGARVEARSRELELPASLLELSGSHEQYAAFLIRQQPATLVLSRQSRHFAGEALLDLLERLEAPVLLLP